MGPYAATEHYFITKVGTRGVLLLLFGTLWSLQGITFLLHPMERFSRSGPGGVLDFLDNGPGVYIYSASWLLGGILSIICAIQRPKTCVDSWGFTALAIPPMLFALGYWWSWALNLFSHEEYGRGGTYVGGLLFTIITLVPMFLSRNLQDHPEGPCWGRLNASK